MTLSFHHAQHRVPEMGELLSPFSALRLQQRREQAINLLLMPIPSHDRHRHHEVLQLRVHFVPELPPFARLGVHRLLPLRLPLPLLDLPLRFALRVPAPARGVKLLRRDKRASSQLGTRRLRQLV